MKYTVENLKQLRQGLGLCTAEYAEAQGLEKVTEPWKEKVKDGQYSDCLSIGPDKGTRYVWTLNGRVKMFQYGEYTLFDNEAERDAYRAQRATERAEEAKRNKLIARLTADLKSKSTGELEQLVAKLN